jgi:hypothetical protein
VTENKLPFPVLVLRESSAQAIGVTWGIDWAGEIPATVIFNADGDISDYKLSQIDPAWLEQAAKKASSS